MKRQSEKRREHRAVYSKDDPRLPRQRAEKGSVESQIPLRLSADMRAAVDAAAEKDGVSVAEWIRGAIGAHLVRRHVTTAMERMLKGRMR